MALKTWLAVLVTVAAVVIALLLAVGTYQHHQPLDAGWAGLLALVFGAALGNSDAVKAKAAQLVAQFTPPAPKAGDPQPKGAEHDPPVSPS